MATRAGGSDEGGADRIDLVREDVLRVGPTTVNPPARSVRHADGRGVTLEPRAMQVLVVMLRADGATVSRDELIERCWDGRIVGDDTISSVLYRLRRDLRDVATGVFEIETVTKVGFRIVRLGNEAEPEPPIPVRIDEASGARASRPKAVLALAAAAALLLILLAGIAWRTFQRQSGPSATIHFAGFRSLGGVPAGLPASIDEFILSAFSEDGQVGIVHGPGTAGIVLSGTVARAGDTMSVSARIENGLTGATLWSRVYERPAAMAQRIPLWIAASTSAVARCGISQIAVHGTPLPDAVAGLVFAECAAEFDDRKPERALDLARRISVIAPDLASGWSSLAFVATENAVAGPPASAAALEHEAAIAVDKALALDPQDARAWHVKAYQVPLTDLVARDRAYQRALKARLSWCGCVFTDYGGFLRAVGRAREARTMLRRAADIVPLNPSPPAGLSQLDAADGRFDEAREAMARVSALKLDERADMQLLVSNAIWLKDYAGALAALERTPPHGIPAMAQAIRDGLRAMTMPDPVGRLAVAHRLGAVVARCGCTNSFSIRLQAALGDASGALAAFAALPPRAQVPMLSTIAWDPVLAEARRLPAFPELARKTGLLAYWHNTGTRPDFCTQRESPPVCRLI